MMNRLRLVTPDFVPDEPLEPNRFDTCYEGPIQIQGRNGFIAQAQFPDESVVEFDYDTQESSLGSLKWETRQQIGAASFALVTLHQELRDEVHWHAEAPDHQWECSRHFALLLRADRRLSNCEIKADSLPADGSQPEVNDLQYWRSYQLSSDDNRLRRYVRIVLDSGGPQSAAEAIRLTASPTVASRADQLNDLFHGH